MPGFNYRMTDIQAAVGREQLKRLPAIVAQRRALADTLHNASAAEAPGVAAPDEPRGRDELAELLHSPARRD